MKTAYIRSSYCEQHDPNPDHPECRERLQVIEQALAGSTMPHIIRIEATPVERSDLLLAHDATHIDRVFEIVPEWGLGLYDQDTVLSPESGDAAMHAVGAVLNGVDLVLSGKVVNAFCAVRPPGHHAHRSHGGGFCLFNNIAIGALYALEQSGLSRVAIVDFDVHHGDGTQDIVRHNPNIFFASTYQFPFYAADETTHLERGVEGKTVVNRGFSAGTSGDVIVQEWIEDILPRVMDFQPECIFVSAGFDGHEKDLMSGHSVTTHHYTKLMRAIVQTADKCCEGRLLVALEGGYELNSLAECVMACLQEMKVQDIHEE